MTRPTIEKALEEANNHAFQEDERASERMIQSAARVILEAEPSEAEVEAMIDAWNTWRGCPLEDRAREALKARDAAKAKEMGL